MNWFAFVIPNVYLRIVDTTSNPYSTVLKQFMTELILQFCVVVVVAATGIRCVSKQSELANLIISTEQYIYIYIRIHETSQLLFINRAQTTTLQFETVNIAHIH